MIPLLDIQSLSIQIPSVNGSREADPVKGVDLSIHPGECVALVGESGSGKSLTAMAVLGLLPRVAKVSSGRIMFRDICLNDLSKRRMRGIRGNRISMIFQEPMNSLNPLHCIEKQVGEVLRVHQGMGRSRARERVVELLEKVGIDNAAQRLNAYPHELSGGQRQRVMLAMALANEPDLLIADEPTTALDVTVARQVIRLLKDLQTETGMAVLFISHDLGMVKESAHRIYVMASGRIVESGNCEQILTAPRHAYTKCLTAVPQFITSGKDKGETRPLLEISHLDVKFPLEKSFTGRVTEYLYALNGISLVLRPGESLGVVGESGAGKSTLARAVLDLVDFSGTVRIKGKEMNSLSGKDRASFRQRIQVVFQDPFASLNPRMTVGDIIYEGPQAMKKNGRFPHERGQKLGIPPDRKELVAWALEKVGLDSAMAARWPHELSGGQRQRVAIARAVVMGPHLLILDEPTSSLDRSLQFRILELLHTLQKEFNMAYLFITHDLKLVQGFCGRVMVLCRGKLVEEGCTGDIFACPAADYTRRLLSSAGI